jgi:hypothetical protein
MENTKQSGKQIALRVTDEMHARLKDIAEKERRSLHAQVVQFLDESITQWRQEHAREQA